MLKKTDRMNHRCLPQSIHGAHSLMFCIIILAVTSSGIPMARAAEVKDHVVMVTAVVQARPPRITLHWPGDPKATGYAVYRRLTSSAVWGEPVAALPSTATEYEDSSVLSATGYEYEVVRAGAVKGYGYVMSGIELPLIEYRGTVELIVDETHAAELATKLQRLQLDLAGDGWIVLRHDVSRSESPVNVKASIVKDYQSDPQAVKAVLLFGHVPVPKSGFMAADGHHLRPWPADLYYGDMTGVWTDEQNLDKSNTPGDGKFDQGNVPTQNDDPPEGVTYSHLPADIVLQVGRVDLSDLPAFAPKTELDLLRQYLDKDHNYRHKLLTAPERALVDDNFGEFQGESFAQNGWRNFATLVGPGNVAAGEWGELLTKETYLWAYGCGPGSYVGCGGVTTTVDIAKRNPQVIFTMLFGSYFGEWDNKDNLLRAPLATSYGLTCAWAGRPHWFFHPMAMGETIGYCALLAQNNNKDQYLPACAWSRCIHIALMGAPTLRMHVVAPPSNLQVNKQKSGKAALLWTPSPDAVLGYHVYRSTTPDGPFKRLNRKLLTTKSFTDKHPPRGPNSYMVRAVMLQTSTTGSYYNASQGVFANQK